MGAEVGVEVGVSSLRYYLTAEDLKFPTRYVLYIVMQADYMVRAVMAARFMEKYRPFRKKKWLPEELDEANKIVYGIIAELEQEFPECFKAKKERSRAWYEERLGCPVQLFDAMVDELLEL